MGVHRYDLQWLDSNEMPLWMMDSSVAFWRGATSDNAGKLHAHHPACRANNTSLPESGVSSLVLGAHTCHAPIQSMSISEKLLFFFPRERFYRL